MGQTIAVVTAEPVLEDTDVVLMAYLTVRSGNDLAAAVQADFASITAQVIDGGVQIGTTITFSVATVIKDTVQTGTIWPVPVSVAPGFNFDAALPRAYLPSGGKDYAVVVTFTLAGGTVYHLEYVIPTLALAGG